MNARYTKDKALNTLDMALDGSPDHDQGIKLARSEISTDTIEWIVENKGLAKQILKIRDYIRETGISLTTNQIDGMSYEFTSDGNWHYPKKYIKGVRYRLNALFSINDPSMIEIIARMDPEYLASLTELLGNSFYDFDLEGLNSLVENFSADQLMAFRPFQNELSIVAKNRLGKGFKKLKPSFIKKLLCSGYHNQYKLSVEQLEALEGMDIDSLEAHDNKCGISYGYVAMYVSLIVSGRMEVHEAVSSFNELVKIEDDSARERFIKNFN